MGAYKTRSASNEVCCQENSLNVLLLYIAYYYIHAKVFQ